MKQRELQDSDNIIWTCIQAFSGTNGEAAKQAAEKAANQGKVTVVCTPSGGEQTVRLELPENWVEEMSDDALMSALLAGRDKS
jgi:hypothetical protein